MGSVWSVPPPPPQKKLPSKSLALLGLITSMIVWVIISGPLKCQQKVTKIGKITIKNERKKLLGNWCSESNYYILYEPLPFCLKLVIGRKLGVSNSDWIKKTMKVRKEHLPAIDS